MKIDCLFSIPRILCGVLLLAVFAVGSVPAHALTSGTKTTGTLTAGGTQTYSFSGTAGQSIMLFGYSSNYTVRVKIFKPGGAGLATSNTDGRILVTALPTKSIYQMVQP